MGRAASPDAEPSFGAKLPGRKSLAEVSGTLGQLAPCSQPPFAPDAYTFHFITLSSDSSTTAPTLTAKDKMSRTLGE